MGHKHKVTSNVKGIDLPEISAKSFHNQNVARLNAPLNRNIDRREINSWQMFPDGSESLVVNVCVRIVVFFLSVFLH